jgi:two-component system cell cycle sensor histidine kinase/response regulator CckA
MATEAMIENEASKRVEELQAQLERVQAQNLAYARDLALLFQQERAELKRLQQTKTQLTHSDRLILIGQLAASVAHDLANLITPIRGYAQLILRKRDHIDTELVDIAERILRASQRANLLLSQMVDLSGERAQTVEVVDLNRLLVEIGEMLAIRFKQSGTRVSQDMLDGPLNVAGNHVQLSQVFVNLLVNAIDAMPNGGSVRIATRIPEPGDMACVAITDTGVGIAPDILSRIFDAFFTTKPEGEGTGLGLSVSKEIVTQYGGHIEVESQPGRGTTFSVWLPTRGDKTAVYG